MSTRHRRYFSCSLTLKIETMNVSTELVHKWKEHYYPLQAVSTMRYIWHISWNIYRSSIATYGIRPMHGLSFANNENVRVDNMWHWHIEDYGQEGCVRYLDFWRIDTIKANVRWFVDPHMGFTYGRAYYPVCTPDLVPSSALTLFEMTSVESRKIIVKRGEGVASCGFNWMPLRRLGAASEFSMDDQKVA